MRRLTDGKVEGVNADHGVPAHAARPGPVSLDRGAFRQQNDDAAKVCHKQADHDGAQQDLEASGVLDAQKQEADGDLEQAGRGEEEDLGVPAQHVVVDVVLFADIDLMPAVAMLGLDALDRCPGDC